MAISNPGIGLFSQICDRGQGNTGAYANVPVVDRSGVRIGTVHEATVGSDLRLVSIRFATTSNVASPAKCIQMTNVPITQAGRSLAVPVTMTGLHQAVMSAKN